MAQIEVRTFWEKLRWVGPLTVTIVVMPATLSFLHVVSERLGLTPNTLILLVLTVFYSLGSGVWVSVILSVESDLYLNYFLTPPYHSFRVEDMNGVTTLIAFLLASTTVSALVKAIATKQEEIEALLERIESLSNKSRPIQSNHYLLGNWSIDLDKRVIEDREDESTNVHLTPIEWRILEVLTRAEGGLVTQGEVLKQVWGAKYSSETNYLRLYLSQLRKKLEDSPKRPVLLLTEAGSGYRAMSKKESISK